MVLEHRITQRICKKSVSKNWQIQLILRVFMDSFESAGRGNNLVPVPVIWLELEIKYLSVYSEAKFKQTF